MLLDKQSTEALKKTDKQLYQIISSRTDQLQGCEKYHTSTFDHLKAQDRDVYELIDSEYDRRQNTIQLLAAENQCSPAVLAALGSIVQNKTAEGFPHARDHGGCSVVDQLETLAVERAKKAFAAQYANVQPHSGTSANQIVLCAALKSGDKILSMAVEQGGHYSHGSQFSFLSDLFETDYYSVDEQTLMIDYEQVRAKAVAFKPKMIICGASAYTRTINFKAFRKIADEVGAYLLADISHISGLVSAGAHPSPIDYAHFTTTSTYKPGGPRGGLILLGRDYDRIVEKAGAGLPLWQCIDKATFPSVQGTPYLNHIAAKAVFFKEMLSSEYRQRQFRIKENAKALADALIENGFEVITGGTDNHMVIIDVSKFRQGLTAKVVQKYLEDIGLVTDAIKLPYGKKTTSGLRLGTPIVTKNGMGPEQMKVIASLLTCILKEAVLTAKNEYHLEQSLEISAKAEIARLCSEFSIQ